MNDTNSTQTNENIKTNPNEILKSEDYDFKITSIKMDMKIASKILENKKRITTIITLPEKINVISKSPKTSKLFY